MTTQTEMKGALITNPIVCLVLALVLGVNCILDVLLVRAPVLHVTGDVFGAEIVGVVGGLDQAHSGHRGQEVFHLIVDVVEVGTRVEAMTVAVVGVLRAGVRAQ